MNEHQNGAFSCLIGALKSPRKVNGYGADYAPIDILDARRLPIIGWIDEIASLSVTYQKVRDNITPEIEAKTDVLLDKWFPEYADCMEVTV